MVVGRVTSTHLAVPVKTEPYLVQLLTIVIYVGNSGLFRMLSCLYCILFCRQTIGIISHWVENIKALKSLEAGVDVAGNVS